MNVDNPKQIRKGRAPSGDGSPPSAHPHSEAWPAEARAAFEALHDELAQLRADVAQLVDDGPPQHERELLTVAEAADMLRISPRSVETMIAARQLSVCDVGPNGGKRLVHRDNLNSYLRESVRT